MTLANRITLFRLAMVPVFCTMVYLYTADLYLLRAAAAVVYALAAVSDTLDGWVARRYKQESALGRRLDPLADKLLINLGFVFMAANEQFVPHVPMWFPVAVLARDVFIVMGAWLINEKFGPVRVNPRFSGKATTALQMFTLIALILALPGSVLLIWINLAFCVWSAADYFLFGWAQVAEKETPQ
jgi:CDP-diacylglycerol--glycerol-3-phosphate 3-phosphatidyltransferase